jgi:hypothetical protein
VLTEGSWDELPRLPSIRPGALNRVSSHEIEISDRLNAVRPGRRNDFLFRALLRSAPHCDDFEALLDCARTMAARHFVDEFHNAFTDAEIIKVATSAWSYEATGRNWVGQEARMHITASEYDALAAHRNGADALFFLTKLRFVHWDRPEFAISPKAMQGSQVIPGWAHGRYRNARDTLIECGILRMVNEGGCGPKDACLCAFAAPLPVKGPVSGPNITRHPPLLSSSLFRGR